MNEARFGLSLWQLQVKFPIQGAAAISTLGLTGLDPTDHPATGAFPIFNFSDDPGNYSPIDRDKDGITKSQSIQFADNLTWIRGRDTMKFGVDVRRVAYQDLEVSAGPTILALSPLTKAYSPETPSLISCWACPRKLTSHSPAPTSTLTPCKRESMDKMSSVSTIGSR